MKNAMTVDVEDYFQVSAFEQSISKENWKSLPSRVQYSTEKLLEVFSNNNVKATFFCLGWVAEKHPGLIQKIVSEGHELASHGYDHTRLNHLEHKSFFDDVRKSKELLEQTGGTRVVGYRAPSFSICESTEWAYDILQEQGFIYSSSTYPIEHDLYGVPDWPRFKHHRDEGIIEIPIPTLRSNGKNKGIGGGGYFRLYPYWLSKRRIERYLREESHPYNFYFHPWEIDKEQPRMSGLSMKSRFRHYINLDKMEDKLGHLLKDFSWGTISEVYDLKEQSECSTQSAT